MRLVSGCLAVGLLVACGDAPRGLEGRWEHAISGLTFPDLPDSAFFPTRTSTGDVWYYDAPDAASFTSRYLGSAWLRERRVDGSARDLWRLIGGEWPREVAAHSPDGRYSAVMWGREHLLVVFSTSQAIEPLRPKGRAFALLKNPACRPAWSPASDEFALLTLPWEMADRETWELAIFTPAGDVLRTRSLCDYIDYEKASLSWSPNGRYLAVLVRDDFYLLNAYDLTTVDATVQGLDVSMSITAGVPQWSADSSSVALCAGNRAYLFDVERRALTALLPSERVTRATWVDETGVLLLLTEGDSSPYIFGEKARLHMPTLVEVATDTVVALEEEARRVNCVGVGCVEGLSDRVRGAFLAWEQ